MRFQLGDHVYIKPVRDTGEVRECFPVPAEYDVSGDSLKTVSRYHEDHLEDLPFKERHRDGSFMTIIRAKRSWRGRRKLEISHHIILPDGSLSSRKFREFKFQS